MVKSAAYFNPEKLEWMNGQYIQRLNSDVLVKELFPLFLDKKLIAKDYNNPELLIPIIDLCKPRAKKLSDFLELADFFFLSKIEFSQEAKKFLLKDKNTKQIFRQLIRLLEKLKQFDLQTVESACRQLIADLGIKPGALIHPVRAALTGKRAGPGLFELMAVLGKEKVLQRLSEAIKL